MSVYKLTCETGKVYYGSTSKTLKHRKSKGWYKCACKDFINPKMELVETVEDLSLLEIVEDKYIRENECVNKNRARVTTEDKYLKNKEWREQKKNYINERSRENRKKIYESKKHYCSLCDIAFQTPKKLERHNNGYRHKLKNESYLIYGEDWKKYYLLDNKKKYNETRKNKNSITPN